MPDAKFTLLLGSGGVVLAGSGFSFSHVNLLSFARVSELTGLAGFGVLWGVTSAVGSSELAAAAAAFFFWAAVCFLVIFELLRLDVVAAAG